MYFVLSRFIIHSQGKNVEVHLCMDPVSRETYVRKRTLKEGLTELRVHQCRREISLQASLSHPHIVPIWCGIEVPDAIVILMDFFDQGDLFEEVLGPRGYPKEPKEAVTDIIFPLLDALLYLHDMDIIHRE